MILRRLIFLCLCLALTACQSTKRDESSVREITVLYTNDEHGWMEGMEENEGAANLFALWQEAEGYRADSHFLVLSGGDNWTGPAISTWTEGESMVEVMNAMDYAAAAVGNHEFDFGVEALRQRAGEADYPYLSANTHWRENAEVPIELGILPFTIKRVNDLTIGIIGLTTRDTATATNPNNVADLVFEDYESALRRTTPQVMASDPDLLLVISHVCIDELEPLIRQTLDLNIDMVGAGHCNELAARQIGQTVLLGGGFHFTAYARVNFRYDMNLDRIINVTFGTNENKDTSADVGIQQIITRWSQRSAATLSEVIAFNGEELSRRADGRLQQAIIDSWLWNDPGADVAITNAGGIRMDLPAGPIDIGTMVALMPFDNTIIALNLSGAAIERILNEGRRPVIAGLEMRDGSWWLTRSGQPLFQQQTYRVLVNSFMFAGGDSYRMSAEEDSQAFDTGIHYRQPFQDWLIEQGSSASTPLAL